eukprot:3926106-Pyramimonas_sp.AAC.1
MRVSSVSGSAAGAAGPAGRAVPAGANSFFAACETASRSDGGAGSGARGPGRPCRERAPCRASRQSCSDPHTRGSGV